MNGNFETVARQVMEVYDKNKDGKINVNEAEALIGDLLRSAGLKADNTTILKIFDAHDLDNNNHLDLYEITELLKKISKGEI